MKEVHVKEIEAPEAFIGNRQWIKKNKPSVARQTAYAGIYQLLSPSFITLGLFEDNKLCAFATAVELSSKNAYFVTDLIKEKGSFVSLKFLSHFFQKNNFISNCCSLAFVEDDLKSLEPVISWIAKKHQLKTSEKWIYTNVFKIQNTQEEKTDEVSNITEIVAGVQCQFYSDKKYRKFILEDNVFSCAYVSLERPIDDEESLKEIVARGKEYAFRNGCSVFILLSDSKKNLGQDFTYLNRFIELAVELRDSFKEVLLKGILI